MRFYDFVPVSTDHDRRFIVMKDDKTYLVNTDDGTFTQTGEGENIQGLISAEKFGMYDRTMHFSEEEMIQIGEIMGAEWVEI